MVKYVAGQTKGCDPERMPLTVPRRGSAFRSMGQVCLQNIFPQIAIAIGILTSNRGRRATNHSCALDVAPEGHCRVQWTWCHCSVLWLSGRGAIAGCHCAMVDRMWCHCWVPLLGAIVVSYG